ncbi:MAG: hypothetical protein WEB58_13930 [Planctomycetaceae bacterium]
MHYLDAIDEIIAKATRIKLPGDRANIVAMARRAFKKGGTCGAQYIDPMERILRECIREWSMEQKREIWESTETGIENSADFDNYMPESIDLDLDGELMYHLIQHLAEQ